MSAKALAQVLVRVWGLVMIIDVTASLGIIATLFTGPKDLMFTLVPSALGIMLRGVFGVMLVRNGDRVGAWLVADIEESGPPADMTQIQIVAFGILGAYFLIAGLALIVGIGYTFLTKPKWDETSNLAYLWERQKEHLGPAIAQTIGGAILLFRRVSFGSAIARSWSAIRGQGESDSGS